MEDNCHEYIMCWSNTLRCSFGYKKNTPSFSVQKYFQQ